MAEWIGKIFQAEVKDKIRLVLSHACKLKQCLQSTVISPFLKLNLNSLLMQGMTFS